MGFGENLFFKKVFPVKLIELTLKIFTNQKEYSSQSASSFRKRM